MIKVLHILAPVEFGGGEALLCNLLAVRSREIMEIIFLLNRSKTFESRLSELSIDYLVDNASAQQSKLAHGFNLGYGLSLAAKSLKYIKIIAKEKPDIIHCHGFPALIFGYICKLIIKDVKVIYTVHSLFLRHSKLQKIFYNHFFKSFDAITCVSNTCFSCFKNNYPKASSVRVIQNCISESFFYESEIPRHRLSGQIVIGQIGRLVKIKQHSELIKAVKLMPHNCTKNIQVLLIGDGPEKSNIAKLINDYNLNDVFSFEGNVDSKLMPSKIDSIDIAVFPSKNESFCLASVEVAARKKLIIAPDSEVFREVLGGYPIYFKDGEMLNVIMQVLGFISASDSIPVRPFIDLEFFKPTYVKNLYNKLYLSLLTR